MRVFVAGATGVLGRRLLPRLVRAGHEVTGMTRTAGKAELIRELGAQPLTCDVYDREKLVVAVGASGSEVVIHLLTDLPGRFNPRADTQLTNRIRREGTRNLLDAAQAAGARRFIAESIAFLYEPSGGGLKVEEDPPWLGAPGAFAETVRAAVELERQVLRSPMDGLVLRFGWLYGPGTWYEPAGSIGRDVRRRIYPIVGDGRGTWSFVHVEDAAHAVVSAIDQGPAGVYNIVDDDPAPMQRWLPAFAEAIGASRPLRAPRWLPRMIAGRAAVEMGDRLVGANNGKAKSTLAWTPRYPSWREGFRSVANRENRQEANVRV